MDNYHAPRWMPRRGAIGGNVQTIWPVLMSRRFIGPRPHFVRERWTSPDGDFIDVDRLVRADAADGRNGIQPAGSQASGEDAAPLDREGGLHVGRPLLVLFHGLEGSSASQYAIAFADRARARGWDFAVPHFRGCSGEINLAPRAYHSGDYEEIGWILRRFRASHRGPMLAAGVSLGGNALMRWAGEAGADAARTVSAVAAISAPLDLAAGGHAIGRGFNRLVYTRMFLGTMRKKALAKLLQHPGLFEREAILHARDLYEFDHRFTAPLHGFASVDDYWSRASAKPHLHRVRVPALLLNARNDPFVPAASLPAAPDVGPCVTLWQPADGGHVGFTGGHWPGHVMEMPEAVTAWLAQHL